MTTNKRTVGQRGFTLLELLIAITLLAIGLLAVASMQGTAIGSNGIANKNTTLSTLAQETLEDIVSWSRDDVRLRTAAANVVYDLDPKTANTSLVLPGLGTFSAFYSITPDSISPKVTRVDVRVTDGFRSVLVSTYRMVMTP